MQHKRDAHCSKRQAFVDDILLAVAEPHYKVDPTPRLVLANLPEQQFRLGTSSPKSFVATSRPWLPTNPSLIRDRSRSLAAVFLWAFGAESRTLAGDPLLLSLKETASRRRYLTFSF